MEAALAWQQQREAVTRRSTWCSPAGGGVAVRQRHLEQHEGGRISSTRGMRGAARRSKLHFGLQLCLCKVVRAGHMGRRLTSAAWQGRKLGAARWSELWAWHGGFGV
jgi:hypothetical protein